MLQIPASAPTLGPYYLFWHVSHRIFTHSALQASPLFRDRGQPVMIFCSLQRWIPLAAVWVLGIAEHKEVKPRTSIFLSLSEGASAAWPLTFSIPLRCLWVFNGGLRGAEASAWFSRVITKRLLKIPSSSHDPRKDLDPTCVRFPFHGLGRTKSTYLGDLFCLLLWISDNESQCFPWLALEDLAWWFGSNDNL